MRKLNNVTRNVTIPDVLDLFIVLPLKVSMVFFLHWISRPSHKIGKWDLRRLFVRVTIIAWIDLVDPLICSVFHWRFEVQRRNQFGGSGCTRLTEITRSIRSEIVKKVVKTGREKDGFGMTCGGGNISLEISGGEEEAWKLKLVGSLTITRGCSLPCHPRESPD